MNITKKRTLIILDWDDTLFPTSWVLNNYSDLTDPGIRAKINITFENLDKLVYKMLCRMSKLGKIVIITNAMPEWVQLSGSMLRNTNDLLKKIEVVSARKDNHSKSHMTEWKKISFDKEFIKHSKKYDTNNIISIGDAIHEYNALIELYKYQQGYLDRYLKTIKLKKNPCYTTLEDQLKVINDKIDDICSHRHHLDLEFNHK
jgi:hypothetical protein